LLPFIDLEYHIKFITVSGKSGNWIWKDGSTSRVIIKGIHTQENKMMRFVLMDFVW